jgi:hypothetical protein
VSRPPRSNPPAGSITNRDLRRRQRLFFDVTVNRELRRRRVRMLGTTLVRVPQDVARRWKPGSRPSGPAATWPAPPLPTNPDSECPRATPQARPACERRSLAAWRHKAQRPPLVVEPAARRSTPPRLRPLRRVARLSCRKTLSRNTRLSLLGCHLRPPRRVRPMHRRAFGATLRTSLAHPSTPSSTSDIPATPAPTAGIDAAIDLFSPLDDAEIPYAQRPLRLALILREPDRARTITGHHRHRHDRRSTNRFWRS